MMGGGGGIARRAPLLGRERGDKIVTGGSGGITCRPPAGGKGWGDFRGHVLSD